MMIRSTRAALSICLVLAACAIEDHTPAGSRRDDEAIQRLLADYGRGLASGDWGALRGLCWSEATYHVATPTGNLVLPIDSARTRLLALIWGGPAPELRILRLDTRQEGDLAAAWLIATRRPRGAPAGDPRETEWTEHLVLRRIGGEWRILAILPANGTRQRQS
ncbi:MAG TPA: hypothetical protein VFU46_07600 [Gemmatimonadales bacterium]|nr:hypothetical protein [Gemmatimonadales bacterium]